MPFIRHFRTSPVMLNALQVDDNLAEVRGRKMDLVAKTEAAVKDRLTKEITYWDHRAEELKLQERAGRPNARLNSDEARKRADLLQSRLQKPAAFESHGAVIGSGRR